jgi:tyrosine-protein phosphatase SIW14
MRNILFALFVLVSCGAHAAETTIPNFAKVTDGLYRGGRPSELDLLYLVSIGVKTDISLQGGDLNNPGYETIVRWWEPGEIPESIAKEKDLAEKLQMTFVHAPLNSIAPITPEEDAAIDQLLLIMNDPLAQPVYIHCEHGKDRSGLLVALYRVKYQGWTAKAAYAEWAKYGHRGMGYWFTGDLDTYFYSKIEKFKTEPPPVVSSY